MLEELPAELNKLLIDQLDTITKSLNNRDKLIKIAVLRELEDIRLNILMLEFDNVASKRERDELQKRLNELM